MLGQESERKSLRDMSLGVRDKWIVCGSLPYRINGLSHRFNGFGFA